MQLVKAPALVSANCRRYGFSEGGRGRATSLSRSSAYPPGVRGSRGALAGEGGSHLRVLVDHGWPELVKEPAPRRTLPDADAPLSDGWGKFRSDGSCSWVSSGGVDLRINSVDQGLGVRPRSRMTSLVHLVNVTRPACASHASTCLGGEAAVITRSRVEHGGQLIKPGRPDTSIPTSTARADQLRGGTSSSAPRVVTGSTDQPFG